MLFSTIFSALLMCGLGTSAALDLNTDSARLPSKSLLKWTRPAATPQLKYAFTAKVDWDLNNVCNCGRYIVARTLTIAAEPHDRNASWNTDQFLESRVLYPFETCYDTR